jgi:hypothetical protein
MPTLPSPWAGRLAAVAVPVTPLHPCRNLPLSHMEPCGGRCLRTFARGGGLTVVHDDHARPKGPLRVIAGCEYACGAAILQHTAQGRAGCLLAAARFKPSTVYLPADTAHRGASPSAQLLPAAGFFLSFYVSLSSTRFQRARAHTCTSELVAAVTTVYPECKGWP